MCPVWIAVHRDHIAGRHHLGILDQLFGVLSRSYRHMRAVSLTFFDISNVYRWRHTAFTPLFHEVEDGFVAYDCQVDLTGIGLSYQTFDFLAISSIPSPFEHCSSGHLEPELVRFETE